MDEKRIEEMLDYIKINYNNDGVTIWDIIATKYSEEELNELLDRGLIYEPLHGYIRVI